MAFAGFPPSEKLLLIRRLIEERMKGSLFARWFLNVGDADDVTLMGTPEATIVTIVETYHVLREQGASAASALSAIEEHRSIRSPRSSQIGSDLEAYVRSRVRLEHRSGKQLSDRDISRACFIANALAEKHISQESEPTQAARAEHIPDQPTGASEEHKADFGFVCSLPESGSQELAGFYGLRQGYGFIYFEHPKTIGETKGFPSPYEYPQVIVVFNEENNPILIVRSEQNASGTLFLCSLDEKGTHTNWGPISPMSRDDFAKEANKIVTQIKLETANAETSRRLPGAEEVAKINILPPLLAEWYALPLFPDDFRNEIALLKKEDALLDKIRKIDPDLALGLSLRRHAAKEEAGGGGVLKHKNPVIEKLNAEFHSLPLFDDTGLATGLDEAGQACLAKIREIDPDLASDLLSQFHERQHKLKIKSRNFSMNGIHCLSFPPMMTTKKPENSALAKSE
jgi:hypothetical protein